MMSELRFIGGKTMNKKCCECKIKQSIYKLFNFASIKLANKSKEQTESERDVLRKICEITIDALKEENQI